VCVCVCVFTLALSPRWSLQLCCHFREGGDIPWPVLTIYFCLWSQLPTVISIPQLNQKHWNIPKGLICKHVSGWLNSVYSWKSPISVLFFFFKSWLKSAILTSSPLLCPFPPFYSAIGSLPTAPFSALLGFFSSLICRWCEINVTLKLYCYCWSRHLVTIWHGRYCWWRII